MEAEEQISANNLLADVHFKTQSHERIPNFKKGVIKILAGHERVTLHGAAGVWLPR